MAIGALWVPGSTAINAKNGFRPGPGVLTPGTVSATGTPDGYVHVTPFQAVLQTARATPGGPYIMTLDAVEDVNVLSTPADPTNPRNDVIIAHQADVYYGDGSSAMTITHVVGTPSGTPADPSLAAYPNCVQLARVRVDALVTSIVSAKITDLRPADLYTVALGGVHPVPSEAVRNALVGMYPGYTIYRTDRKWIEEYDGTYWRVQGVPLVSSLSDCAAITHPLTGMLASDSSARTRYRYTGSAWEVQEWKYSYTTTGTEADITVSPIPSTLKTLEITLTARSTISASIGVVFLQINGDGGFNYYNSYMFSQAGATGYINTSANATWTIGYAAGASSTAGLFVASESTIVGWDNPHASCLTAMYRGGFYDSTTNVTWNGGGAYKGAGPYTSLRLSTGSGSFVVGTEVNIVGR